MTRSESAMCDRIGISDEHTGWEAPMTTVSGFRNDLSSRDSIKLPISQRQPMRSLFDVLSEGALTCLFLSSWRPYQLHLDLYIVS